MSDPTAANSSQNQATPPVPPNGGNGNGRKRRKRSPVSTAIWLIVLLTVVVFGAIYGGRFYVYATTHESTDDAYLANDVIEIAPQVTGYIETVPVDNNRLVKAGQLLVQIDDSTYRARVRQAQADLAAAMARANGAGLQVKLTQATGGAQLQQAQGLLAQSESGINEAESEITASQASVSQAEAGAKTAEAGVDAAAAALQSAQVAEQRLAAAAKAAAAQVDTAKANVLAAQAQVKAAQATAANDTRNMQRYQALVAQGAVSQQTADQAVTTAQTAQAQVDSSEQQVQAAQAAVSSRQADLAAAQEQVKAAQAGVQQAQAQVAAARQQATAAEAAVKQAQAHAATSVHKASQARAQRTQAIGQMRQAQTSPQQVAVSKSSHSQALAQVKQAEAALKSAMLDLEHTRIVAPVDGTVSQKTAEVGALVQPGTPLMAIVPTEVAWVDANYKETQLTHMEKGQPATISVDAFPGDTYTGHVDSISRATGAVFALLPPENATGNFTKVVQRIPVKIVLDPKQPKLERLRAGMSVEATVTTK